mgnify:CR=1 FL=1
MVKKLIPNQTNKLIELSCQRTEQRQGEKIARL